MNFKVGGEARLNSGNLPSLKVKILRKSKISGKFTVKLLESSPTAPAYVVGTELLVSTYELRSAA